MSPSPFETVPPGLLPPIYPWSEVTHPDTEIEVPAPWNEPPSRLPSTSLDALCQGLCQDKE